MSSERIHIYDDGGYPSLSAMSDRQLIVLAKRCMSICNFFIANPSEWNPLNNDSDAFELLVAIGPCNLDLDYVIEQERHKLEELEGKAALSLCSQEGQKAVIRRSAVIAAAFEAEEYIRDWNDDLSLPMD